jgi:hypothetical protein
MAAGRNICLHVASRFGAFLWKRLSSIDQITIERVREGQLITHRWMVRIFRLPTPQGTKQIAWGMGDTPWEALDAACKLFEEELDRPVQNPVVTARHALGEGC